MSEKIKTLLWSIPLIVIALVALVLVIVVVILRPLRTVFFFLIRTPYIHPETPFKELASMVGADIGNGWTMQVAHSNWGWSGESYNYFISSPRGIKKRVAAFCFNY